MRERHKHCSICDHLNQVLFRCRYDRFESWQFLCDPCLQKIKVSYPNSYQYGGTWKAIKK
jgi:hypothetical protein